jgi:hypothetical protein
MGWSSFVGDGRRLRFAGARPGRSIGAVGIIVETAREALAKVAEFVEDGNSDVVIKDLLGNVLDRATVAAQAESEG